MRDRFGDFTAQHIISGAAGGYHNIESFGASLRGVTIEYYCALHVIRYS